MFFDLFPVLEQKPMSKTKRMLLAGLLPTLLVITFTLMMVGVAGTEMAYFLKALIIVGLALVYVLSYLLIYRRSCPYVKRI